MNYNSYPSWYTAAIDPHKATPKHTPNPTASGVTYQTPPKEHIATASKQDDDPPSLLTPMIVLSSPAIAEEKQEQHLRPVPPSASRSAEILTMIETATQPLMSMQLHPASSTDTDHPNTSNEPSRIISALDLAATPLLETVQDMIQAINNKQLTTMLKNLLHFFDIVIRAAKKSADLYANAHQQKEIDQARQILRGVGTMEDSGGHEATINRFKQFIVTSFYHLIHVSSEALNIERDHSNLLEFCRKNAAVGPNKNEGALDSSNDLIGSSANRTRASRVAYMEKVEKIKEEMDLLMESTGLDAASASSTSSFLSTQLTAAIKFHDDYVLNSTTQDTNSTTITIDKTILTALQNDLLESQTLNLMQKETNDNYEITIEQLNKKLVNIQKVKMNEQLETLSLVQEQRDQAEREKNTMATSNRALMKELKALKEELNNERKASVLREYEFNMTNVSNVSNVSNVAILEQKVQNIEETYSATTQQQHETTSIHRSRTSSVIKAVQGALSIGQQSLGGSTVETKTTPMTSNELIQNEQEIAALISANEIQLETKHMRTIQQLQHKLRGMKLHKATLEQELLVVREELETNNKKWSRKSEMIQHLQSIATKADRSRMKALEAVAHEKYKTKLMEQKYGPDLIKLNKEHETTSTTLERVRTSRTTLMQKLKIVEEELASYQTLEVQHNAMSNQMNELIARDKKRTKLLTSMEQKLTIARIQQHQHQSPTKHTASSILNTLSTIPSSPLQQNGAPFVSGPLSPTVTHNIKLSASASAFAAPSPTSIAANTAATAAATAAHAARELSTKLSAARNTIEGLKSREAKLLKEMKEHIENNVTANEDQKKEFILMKQRLDRSDDSLRKLRSSNLTLKRSLRTITEEKDYYVSKHDDLQIKHHQSSVQSDKARSKSLTVVAMGLGGRDGER